MYNEQTQSVDNLIETDALVEQHIHGGFGIDFSLCTAEDVIEFSKKFLNTVFVHFSRLLRQTHQTI